jgi:glucose-1-phosphate thymidylyltransferase
MACSVVLLAGGYATRLFPLTKDRPKALLPLSQGARGKGRGARVSEPRVILDEVVASLSTVSDLRRRILVTNHRFAAQFKRWRRVRRAAMTIVDDRTTTPQRRLGAIGDLALAVRRVPPADDLLIVGTDNLFRWPLGDFVSKAQAFRPSPSIALWRAPSLDQAAQFGVVRRNRSGRILMFAEKAKHPPSREVALCVYYVPWPMRASIQEFLEAGGNADAPGYLFHWLVAHGRTVHGVMMPGPWYDIGTPASYHEMLKEWDHHERPNMPIGVAQWPNSRFWDAL